MSYHVLHVLQPFCTLAKERGFIVCRGQDNTEKKLPHEDIRAVIIAARGVNMSASFVSAILESDAVVLHCDESYRPCGITTALPRVVDRAAFLRQASRPKRLNDGLWGALLRGKTVNQQRVLEAKDCPSPHLAYALNAGKPLDEGNCARRYWQLYFPAIGWISTKRERKEDSPPNQMLNYGYAVLSALCHRSLLIHGLSPQLGVKHSTRYKADPLVYDLMEPFRPIVDLMLAEFMVSADISFRAWAQKVGQELRERRVHHERYTLKLMDAIDTSASSMARSYAENTTKTFWVPTL
ncbi:MAG: type II CRISPR-associated endonuclease Cas1 [Puniceicoccales bacterium]|jgi:CRISPR-associated protein Cas1|nr:type II CRISPR-associated endonuclease Cas1 [Puniceicoccales bacterium]